MSVPIYLVAVLFSLFFVLFVVELVRRGALREQYSLLWLGLGLAMLVLSASPRLLRTLADWFGVYYAPSLLFLFSSFCAFALLLHITVALSKLADRVIRLTQELAIAEHRIQELERRLPDGGTARGREGAGAPEARGREGDLP
ncbi:hypothetical protein GCM10010885_18910 [Alicyclobacillus cellulosilyticus]|uniref:DUF2304 domain-containing protein n=1 Tax=Alicyclobacillus cellulosilyticus TaxID=1003997 RepID=A0A917KD93_9BACL|nr:DUF2304 domain-containing protein [Alicyclobacillus cellulosilyticus]GGJ09962.1 hypothetical protein GCM10010885_18910 [Alicyclobacillus cellulosilyticus]